MLDCLLVNTPSALGVSALVESPRLPIGLMYLASVLREAGMSVEILDCHSRSMLLDEIIVHIERLAVRFVGLNIHSPNRKVAFELCTEIRNRFPNTQIVVGGPHASCSPRDVVESCPAIDYVVVGEAENVITGIVRRDERPDHTVIIQGTPVISLDGLPLPAYDLVDYQPYLALDNQAYISASRGCRYRCSFCSSNKIWGRGVRFRSAGSVITEIECLRGLVNCNSFYFYDDNVLVWPDLRAFCEESRKTGIEWTAQANVRDITDEAVAFLELGGCARLSFGFESGSKRLQRQIGKILPPNAMARIASVARKGIAVRGFFILGFPSETPDDILDTVELALALKRNGMSDLAIFGARPYPGTRLFDECLASLGVAESDLMEFDYLDDRDAGDDEYVKEKLRLYNTAPARAVNGHFSTREIRKLIARMYMEFEHAGSQPVRRDVISHRLFAGMSL